MNVEAYKQWINLYSSEVEQIWTTERKELRIPAMILKILEQEFKRMQDNFNLQLSQFRDQYNAFEKHKNLLSPDTSATLDTKEIDMDLAMSSPRLDETEKTNIFDDSLDILSINSSPVVLTNNSEINIMEISEDSVHTSPKINKQQKYFSKRKSKFNTLDCTITKSLEKKTSPVENLPTVATPKALLEEDDLINCTMIDGTPVLNKNLKKARTLLEASRKRNHSRFKKSANDTTLTQMFSNQSSRRDKTELKTADVTDETFCGSIEQSIPADENVPIGNKNCDDIKPRREVICKEPVVRGKARQKLEGWDCKECEKFYEALGVNTPERKQLQNQCSKHRANRKRDDHTPPGFWSMNFPPTQDTEKSSTSMYFQY